MHLEVRAEILFKWETNSEVNIAPVSIFLPCVCFLETHSILKHIKKQNVCSWDLIKNPNHLHVLEILCFLLCESVIIDYSICYM